jgi:hypothetical protein
MEKSDSDSGSYGDYNDGSSDDNSSNNDNSGDMGAFAGDSDDDKDTLEEPGLLRLTSQQIGREYTPSIINPTKLFAYLNGKIVEVKERFEYVNLDEGLVLKYLRNNHFLVEDTI